MRHHREWHCCDADFTQWDHWNDPHNSIDLFYFFIPIPMYFSTKNWNHQSSHITLWEAASFWEKCKRLNWQNHCKQCDSTLHSSCFYFDITVIYRMSWSTFPMLQDCMYSSTLRDMNLCITVSESIYLISAYFELWFFAFFNLKYLSTIQSMLAFWNPYEICYQ